jgi:excisionase family DNA binding protein
LKEWVTLKEAAIVVERDESTVREWIRLGKLASYKIGPSICVKTADALKVEAAQYRKKHRLGA